MIIEVIVNFIGSDLQTLNNLVKSQYNIALKNIICWVNDLQQKCYSHMELGPHACSRKSITTSPVCLELYLMAASMSAIKCQRQYLGKWTVSKNHPASRLQYHLLYPGYVEMYLMLALYLCFKISYSGYKLKEEN